MEDFEIKQISESEFWVGENRYYFDKDNILYINAIGELNEELAKVVLKAHTKLTNKVEGKVFLLVDLNKAGKPSANARKIILEITDSEKCEKSAFFGMHPVARMVASFTIGISKNKKMQFFKNVLEARNWLKQ